MVKGNREQTSCRGVYLLQGNTATASSTGRLNCPGANTDQNTTHLKNTATYLNITTYSLHSGAWGFTLCGMFVLKQCVLGWNPKAAHYMPNTAWLFRVLFHRYEACKGFVPLTINYLLLLNDWEPVLRRGTVQHKPLHHMRCLVFFIVGGTQVRTQVSLHHTCNRTEAEVMRKPSDITCFCSLLIITS